MRIILALSVVALLGMGCRAPSMNVQRSGLRGVGDVAATVLLERVPEAAVPVVREKALEVIAQCDAALSDGVLPGMSLDALKKILDEKVPEQYKPVSDAVLKVVRGIRLPTEALGENNAKRIRAALVGIKSGVTEYKVGDRNPVVE